MRQWQKFPMKKLCLTTSICIILMFTYLTCQGGNGTIHQCEEKVLKLFNETMNVKVSIDAINVLLDQEKLDYS